MSRRRAARGGEDQRRADQRDAVPEQRAVDYQQLQAAFKALQATNAALQAENARLQERVSELERRLGLDSTTSSQPPSSDGPRKPPARRRTSSLRGKSKRKPGGQKGHKGTTLQRTDQPKVQNHWPQQCSDCGAPLEAADATGQPVARQVFDLPEPQPPEVTEHRAHACRCAQCGGTTRAEFPEGVQGPVQYGPRLAAVVVYLQCAHFLPERRLAQWLQDLFGVSLCAATAARMTRTLADRWQGFTEQVHAWIRTSAPVKHLDETGYRIRGRTQWLHVLSTPLLTFYRTSAKRSAVGRGLVGCLVHDCWQSYFRVPGVVHALCNAHILRELQALVKIDQEDWAGRLQRLLRRAVLYSGLFGKAFSGLNGRRGAEFSGLLASGWGRGRARKLLLQEGKGRGQEERRRSRPAPGPARTQLQAGLPRSTSNACPKAYRPTHPRRWICHIK